jgi:hypothetical protein
VPAGVRRQQRGAEPALAVLLGGGRLGRLFGGVRRRRTDAARDMHEQPGWLVRDPPPSLLL